MVSADSTPGRRRGLPWRAHLRTWLGRLPKGLLVASVLVLSLLPVAMVLYGSFRDGPPGPGSAWGTQGWRSALSDPLTLETFRTSFTLAAFGTLSTVTVAVLLAWLITRTDLPGARWLERAVMLGVFVPAIASAIAWAVLANGRGGTLNQLLGALLGRDVQLINIYSMPGLVFHYTTVFAPLVFFLILGSFKVMDSSLEEAARVFGARLPTTALRVTIPVMGLVIAAGAILAFVRILESFEIPQILGVPAGISVFMTRIYAVTMQAIVPNYPFAMALAMIVLLVTFTLVAIQVKYVERRAVATVSGKSYRSGKIMLGRLRWPSFAIVFGFVLVAIVLPVSQIFMASFQRVAGVYSVRNWTLDGWRTVLADEGFWLSLRNTIIFSVGGGLLVMTITTAAAYVIVRNRAGASSRVLSLATWAPWALPGLILGVGLLWAYSGAVLPIQLLGTPWVLIIAFVTLGLPLGTRIMSGALVTLGGELEEAGRVHGASWQTSFRLVIIPLIRTSFSFGFVLSFVQISRDVGTPVLLASPGNSVLAVDLLDAWINGDSNVAIVLSSVLVLLAFVFLLLEGAIKLVASILAASAAQSADAAKPVLVEA